MEEIKHTKCPKCKCWRTENLFLNDKGRRLKTCGNCRQINKLSKERNKCEHNRVKSKCKKCGGASICEHNRQKSHCKKCGGSQICEHNRIKSQCKECCGASICEHNRRKVQCKECDPIGYLSSIVRNRTFKAIKSNKTEQTMEYLGCSIEEFKNHIESQFTEWMNWDNYGEWHIDHITPLKYGNPTLEELIERLHYKNTQPLRASDNMAKNNHYIG